MSQKVVLYVTKWVLARGILVFPATKVDRREYKSWYYLELQGRDKNRMGQVALGTGAFLTLEEAQEDAEWRFRKAARDLAAAAQRATRGLQLAEARQILVHHVPPHIKACHAHAELIDRLDLASDDQ